MAKSNMKGDISVAFGELIHSAGILSSAAVLTTMSGCGHHLAASNFFVFGSMGNSFVTT